MKSTFFFFKTIRRELLVVGWKTFIRQSKDGLEYTYCNYRVASARKRAWHTRLKIMNDRRNNKTYENNNVTDKISHLSSEELGMVTGPLVLVLPLGSGFFDALLFIGLCSCRNLLHNHLRVNLLQFRSLDFLGPKQGHKTG
jgi:hypothetical protein